MRNGVLAVFLLWGAALSLGVSSAYAGEVDLLVQKLVEKGVLAPNEAQILMDETRQDVAKQNAKGANDMLPSWIQTTKLKGDLRLRYQSQQKKSSTSTGGTVRNRGRIRYRLGLETKPNEKVTVAAGLASAEKISSTSCAAGSACTVSNGVDDSRSTNLTMQNGFSRGDIRLDYAYADYKYNSSLRMIGGKYNAMGTDYLWYTSDMLWDSDINQEGASVHADFARVLLGDAFVNAGYWVLDESSSMASDLGMYYAQAGMVFEPIEAVNFKLAGTFYGMQNDDSGSLIDGRVSGNTVASSRYVYDFGNIYAGSAELVYSWPEETSSPIKMVGLFGDYVMNPDPNSDNTGYAAGLKIGHKKVSGAKTWQFKYQYVRLASDAWLDDFPDSDRYSGGTNIKGNELILDIGLAKNVSLGLDYYMSDVLKGQSYPERIFQADINLKF